MLDTLLRDAAAKTVLLPMGVQLAYEESGDPDGPPVILLHGYTDSLRSFDRLRPHLPPSHRAIALSQRGHGNASRPRRGYHPRDFADDLAAFMDALDIESAVIVGHSMGGQIAQRFAIQHAARVRGLVLIGAFASLGGNATIREFWNGAVSTLSDPVAPAFAREFQISTLANSVPPAFLDIAVTESLKVPARIWRDALAGQMDEDVSGELSRIGTPALLLWGHRDALIGRDEQDRLLNGLRDALLKTYAGVGHAAHWEVPGRVAGDIAAFLTRIGA
jgi:non-heme chloroperoxidase